MSSIRVKAELILGEGEFLKVDQTVDLEDIEVSVAALSPTGESITLSANSLLITSDQPLNTDILDGTPQTSVRLLVMLADPA